MSEETTTNFKVFATQADFDAYSASIRKSTEEKCAKEFSTKQAEFLKKYNCETVDGLDNLISAYDTKDKKAIAALEERDKILSDLTKDRDSRVSANNEYETILKTVTNGQDFTDLVKMSRSLVDENTDFATAFNKVYSMSKGGNYSANNSLPTASSNSQISGENPFLGTNQTEIAMLINTDPSKALKYAKAAGLKESEIKSWGL